MEQLLQGSQPLQYFTAFLVCAIHAVIVVAFATGSFVVIKALFH
jgi:hypothetical protein